MSRFVLITDDSAFEQRMRDAVSGGIRGDLTGVAGTAWPRNPRTAAVIRFVRHSVAIPRCA